MAAPRNDGGPAFPLNTANERNVGAFDPCPGMTLRDWFAGQALQGLLANPGLRGAGEAGDSATAFSMIAYHYADAMLAEQIRVKEAA